MEYQQHYKTAVFPVSFARLTPRNVRCPRVQWFAADEPN